MEGVVIFPQSQAESLVEKVDAFFNALQIMQLNKQEVYLTLKQVCDKTGFSPKWVHLNKEKIGFCKVGSDLRFKRSDVEAFMEANYFKVQLKLAKKRRAS